MKKFISIVLFFAVIFISCNDTGTKSSKELYFLPQNSIKELIVKLQEYRLDNVENYTGIYKNYKLSKFKKEIPNSIKIVEELPIEKTNLTLVFYTLNIGADIIRASSFIIKEDNKYYITSKYFSSYKDDPFKNGKPEEAKKILKKKERWDDDNESVDWY